jgi:hypothetical protein
VLTVFFTEVDLVGFLDYYFLAGSYFLAASSFLRFTPELLMLPALLVFFGGGLLIGMLGCGLYLFGG